LYWVHHNMDENLIHNFSSDGHWPQVHYNTNLKLLMMKESRLLLL
jgi:hypothetical protein